MRVGLRKVGNSKGIIIPAPLLAMLKMTDEVELRQEGQRLVIEPVQATRSGWAEAAVKIADANTEAEIWPAEFSDENSGEWVW